MNAQVVKKVLDTLPSYMVAEWALPALINGDYTGIIPLDAPESCGEVAMIAQFDEGMDCDRCQLCAKNRKVVIIFGIHGSHKGKARKAIQIHKAKI